jgi:ferredoxin
VDCIHPKKEDPKHGTEEMLYIDPVECIDCGACVPVCPVSAIFALDDLPEGSAFTSATLSISGANFVGADVLVRPAQSVCPVQGKTPPTDIHG